MAEELKSLEGIVETIIFSNEDNGYTVCELHTNDTYQTVVGYLPYVSEGDSIRIYGNFVVHKEYGEQFSAVYYEKVAPRTALAIIKYLSSGIVKGIGPKLAQKIVEQFGENTLQIIEREPLKLAQIRGISEKKALDMGKSYQEQMGIQNIVMFLQQYSISPAIAIKIHKKYAEQSVERLKENPYLLCREVYGIGFKTADRIAMAMGIAENSVERVKAGVMYILNHSIQFGHTYLPQNDLKIDCNRLLNVQEEELDAALAALIMEKQIVAEGEENDRHYYLAAYYFGELGVARRLLELQQSPLQTQLESLEDHISTQEAEDSIQFAPAQKEAIISALSNCVAVITGGPGTGKTTIINTIIKIMQKNGFNVLLAAPTGRAAKRMTELCHMEAKTIHRLLEIGYSEGGEEQMFHRNDENPIPCDVLIVDEVSMVDILLMYNLLKALKNGTRLILVGDSDQLPSVGAGNVLKDIIKSNVIKTVALQDIFRQAQESMIVVNAHRINKGIYPVLNVAGKDFFFLERGMVDAVVDTVIDLCKNRIPKSYRYDSITQIQVLCPMRKTAAGVFHLNERLQEALNPPQPNKPEKVVRDMVFRVGDKVMQVKNNYDIIYQKIGGEDGLGVFNGDFGIVYEIDHDAEELTVLFDDDRLVRYDFNQLDELELAYAVTIHKSQGSEFPVVIMPLSGGPPVLMTRNLFYTAVTRAKELVILVGSEGVIRRMVDNNRETKRYSNLCEKLIQCSTIPTLGGME